MKAAIDKHLMFTGFIYILLTGIQPLHAKNLENNRNKPLNAPTTKALYDDLIKEGKKKITPESQKTLESHTYDDENHKNAEELNPTSSAIHHNIGLCLKKNEETDRAIEHFKETVHLRPHYMRAYMHWGMLMVKQGKKDEALEIFNKALSINPDNAMIQREAGCIYRDQNKFDQAIEAFSKAHELEPTTVAYIQELANTLSMIDDHERALQLYQSALEIDPNLNSALYNIGYILKRKGYIEAAIDVFNKVLERSPSDEQAHFSLSLCYLTMGNFDLGWPEYEWRWHSYNNSKPKIGNKPYWDGSSLDGKTILITCEQGLGDTFQFIRYAKVLRQRGARIVLLAQKPIKTILQTGCDYLDHVVIPGEPIPPFDYQVPLMSLPFILNTQVETIPVDIPYIKADPALVAYWKTLLSATTFNVGICWQGNAHYRNQLVKLVVAAKSITLDSFMPLTNVKDCTFYSLQKINGTEQLEGLGTTTSIVDFGNEVDEKHGRFMDTAAIIMNLDLIITIDTSIAHLAAALGKPTWVLLPNSADWRWMLTRNDTPWYPHVRLFRQQTAGDWKSTMNEVIQALKGQVARTQTMPSIDQSQTCLA